MKPRGTVEVINIKLEWNLFPLIVVSEWQEKYDLKYLRAGGMKINNNLSSFYTLGRCSGFWLLRTDEMCKMISKNKVKTLFS